MYEFCSDDDAKDFFEFMKEHNLTIETEDMTSGRWHNSEPDVIGFYFTFFIGQRFLCEYTVDLFYKNDHSNDPENLFSYNPEYHEKFGDAYLDECSGCCYVDEEDYCVKPNCTSCEKCDTAAITPHDYQAMKRYLLTQIPKEKWRGYPRLILTTPPGS